jgi:hypothetical protein
MNNESSRIAARFVDLTGSPAVEKCRGREIPAFRVNFAC